MPARRDSSDDDEIDTEAAVRTCKRPKNPFVLDEAEDDDEEGESDNDYNYYEFIDDE